MEDAINKIKSNPNFDQSNSSPEVQGDKPSLIHDPGSPNIILNQDEESISFEESNWKFEVKNFKINLVTIIAFSFLFHRNLRF